MSLSLTGSSSGSGSEAGSPLDGFAPGLMPARSMRRSTYTLSCSACAFGVRFVGARAGFFFCGRTGLWLRVFEVAEDALQVDRIRAELEVALLRFVLRRFCRRVPDLARHRDVVGDLVERRFGFGLGFRGPLAFALGLGRGRTLGLFEHRAKLRRQAVFVDFRLRLGLRQLDADQQVGARERGLSAQPLGDDAVGIRFAEQFERPAEPFDVGAFPWLAGHEVFGDEPCFGDLAERDIRVGQLRLAVHRQA